MSGRRRAKRADYRVNLRLDHELDANLIAWMEAQPRGALSQAIREALRRGLEVEGHAQQQSTGYDYIRQIVSDELARALAGLRFQTQPINDDTNASATEAMYGTKLDQMLGDLSVDPNLGGEESP